MESPSLTPAVEQIADRLEAAGFEAWLVGGSIRDHLLGIRPSDYDITTNATPEQVRKVFGRVVDVGAVFGTVGVLVEGVLHEITTFRHDVSTDGRRAVVAYATSIEEDLKRRDFTMNAIAFRPADGQWADPHEGRQDLRDHVLRAVGDPMQRYAEDHLRIIRAARFVCRFMLRLIDKDAAVASAHLTKDLSAERVQAEWFKTLVTTHSRPSVPLAWWELGIAPHWIPEMHPDVPVEHQYGSWIPGEPVVLTAWMCARPGDVLRRLKCSRSDIQRATVLHDWETNVPTPEPAAVRRWMAGLTRQAIEDILKLHQLAGTNGDLSSFVMQTYAHRCPIAVSQLAITGHDLLEMGLRGSAIGRTQRAALDWVLEDPTRNTRQQLLGYARGFNDI